MRILFLLFFLHTVFGDEFGTPYMKPGRLCQPWTCINGKLGLPNRLPSREQYRQVLEGLLPNTWHGVVQTTLDSCYGNRTRRYTNTCPAQALLHCTMDQLYKNCPEAFLKKNDGCSPMETLAGFDYMFSQGRYENLEANLPYETRPAWFIRHYFSATCCNLPELFNSSVLVECGFDRMLHYHQHGPLERISTQSPIHSRAMAPATSSDSLLVANLPPVPQNIDVSDDPLECCDMSGFIQPSWRSECDFRMKWDAHQRLTIDKATVTTTAVPTTTTTAKPRLDVKVLPLSCAQETCVFRKLNIISESGIVDIDAFSKLLNNLTADQPAWAKAKARVVTKCFSRPLFDYREDCEINKVLACTFDVLSANCPNATKHDPCKHSSTVPSNVVCQISSAKYVPKNRHRYCEVPSLVRNDAILQECGVSSINRLEYSTHAVPVPSKRVPMPMCTKLTDSTTCLLSKMGVLNKYQFMDYFKMKASIRDFVSAHSEWLALNDAYLNAFTTMPMYREYCSSPKKLLNLLDSMLMTCPLSKRKSSPKCYKIFNEMSRSPMRQNSTKEQLEQILRQFQHIFLPVPNQETVLRKPHKVTKKLYDFGILNDGNAPRVTVIDVNPTARPIQILLPVYQQDSGNLNQGLQIHGWHNNGILRGGVGRG